MADRVNHPRQSKADPPGRRRSALVLIAVGVALVAAGVVFRFANRSSTLPLAGVGDRTALNPPRPPGSVTFAQEVAPILFRQCAGCHRPGQSAPFPLLTYEDARKRARQIVEVTTQRLMPPWLPEPGLVEYADARVLSAEELGVLRQWAEEGAPEGNPADLPPLPRWSEGWQLGTPDLVVRMPESFAVPADGRDVYRNFAMPVSIDATRFVEAVEFRPGNSRVVHHAAMKIDRTRFSRELDAREAGAGFGGMNLPETTEAPGGHFLNWQPGKLAYRAPAGLGWTLEPGTDFVMQLHLHPTGKPEQVLSEAGFYFTDRPPTNSMFKIILDWPAIDIAPGETNYVIEDRYVLPVDVQALAIFPHAHYLAREMQGFATLPDGTRRWLLRIPNWDFNWQGDYRFARPVSLPRGTELRMRFTYDNSTNNARNPHQPPRRVLFGPQTTDEMGELWLQVLTRSAGELAQLARDYGLKQAEKSIAVNRQRLRNNPDDPRAHLQIGRALLSLNRQAEAAPFIRTAAVRQPDSDEARYYHALVLRMEGQLEAARREFEIALQLNPNHYKAHGNLGMISLDQGDLVRAEHHFQAALRLNPEDPVAQSGLARIARSGDAPRR